MPDAARQEGGSLEAELESMGLEIRRALADLIEPLTGVAPSPADVREVLELDRTQSWRISRVLMSRDPYEILHESPAPKGLSLIVDAAERAGASSASARQARAVVSSFAGLIAKFPDGAVGLKGALASRVPRAEEASMNAARSKISQGMAQLLGIKAAVRYVASIVGPSPGFEGLADVVAVAGYKDLRRLRAGPSPAVFSGRTYTKAIDASAPAVETLEGTTDPDPRLRLLDEFSELDPASLVLETSGEERRLVLAPDQPPLNEPMTLFFAQRLARSLETVRTNGADYDLVHHTPLLPCDVNVFDTLVHESLFNESDPPAVTVERFGFDPGVQRAKPDDEVYRVGPGELTQELGRGLRRATIRAVPRVPELLAHTFERIGEDPGAYRMYRATKKHIPPGFAAVIWLRVDGAVGPRVPVAL